MDAKFLRWLLGLIHRKLNPGIEELIAGRYVDIDPQEFFLVFERLDQVFQSGLTEKERELFCVWFSNERPFSLPGMAEQLRTSKSAVERMRRHSTVVLLDVLAETVCFL